MGRPYPRSHALSEGYAPEGMRPVCCTVEVIDKGGYVAIGIASASMPIGDLPLLSLIQVGDPRWPPAHGPPPHWHPPGTWLNPSPLSFSLPMVI